MSKIQVSINGEKYQFLSPLKLTDLLENLDFSDKKIAIEINQALYPKNQFDKLSINNGDVIEIITAVGGG